MRCAYLYGANRGFLYICLLVVYRNFLKAGFLTGIFRNSDKSMPKTISGYVLSPYRIFTVECVVYM